MWFSKINATPICLHTSECVNQFRRLHLIQVGSTVPWGCHHLSASNQPISCNHYALVAFQGCSSNPDSGDLARAFAVHLSFFSVWRVLIVITRSLLVYKAREKIFQSTHSDACRDKDSFGVSNTPLTTLQYLKRPSRKGKATHTDIWWWLRGWKLYHVAPDVSRLVPGGCGNVKHTSTDLQNTMCWRQQRPAEDTPLAIDRINTFNIKWSYFNRMNTVPVRAICSVGWNLIEFTVGNRRWDVCYIKYPTVKQANWAKVGGKCFIWQQMTVFLIF